VNYRNDIDGMRALAVVAVVVYHLDPTWLPGGYIGVDMFFVISGYLITRQVAEKLVAGEFSYADFYARRARRLLPAALTTMVATSLAAIVLLPQSLLAEYWGSVSFTAVSAANLYFWKTTSYFDAAAHTKPLLHMWSLGVEEQFYLVWPALLVTAHRLRRGLTPPTALAIAMLGVLAASLLGTWQLMKDESSAAFYLMHLRGWEFAVGGLVCLGLFEHKMRRFWRELLPLVGLSILGWCFLSYSSDTEFPGLGALLPCLGTALVIGVGSGTIGGGILGHSILSAIGRVSYSVYLAHWPLIVFYRALHPAPGSDLHLALLGVASLALGGLSWRFIEERFRLRPKAVQPWSGPAFGLACALLSLAVVTVSGALSATTKDEGPGATPRNQRMLDFVKAASGVRHGNPVVKACYTNGKQAFRPDNCLSKPDPAAPLPRILLLGDSLAAYLYPGLSAYFEGKVSVDLAASTSCRPVHKATRKDLACRTRTEEVFEKADLSGYDAIWLHGNFHETKWIDLIPGAVKRLRARGAKEIALLGPGPGYADRVSDIISKMDEREHSVVLGALTESLVPEHFEFEARTRGAASRAKIQYVSTLKARCPTLAAASCVHTMGADGNPIVLDAVHLSPEGGAWLMSRIALENSPRSVDEMVKLKFSGRK
jgi:peptidoglycan/LPS O-acetylase OafA/YrhL